jgi:hypothetical protein
MMTPEESAVVKTVYARFIDSEGGELDHSWTGLDDSLELFGWLSDIEIVREAGLKVEVHSYGEFSCSNDHEKEFCFAPFILESVEAILNLYEKTGELHENNRYILQYYCALSEMNMIFSSVTSSAV